MNLGKSICFFNGGWQMKQVITDWLNFTHNSSRVDGCWIYIVVLSSSQYLFYILSWGTSETYFYQYQIVTIQNISSVLSAWYGNTNNGFTITLKSHINFDNTLFDNVLINCFATCYINSHKSQNVETHSSNSKPWEVIK